MSSIPRQPTSGSSLPKGQKIMYLKVRAMLRPLTSIVRHFGFANGTVSLLRHYPRFRHEKKEWLRQGGHITLENMILADYSDTAGTATGHYFHQDLLVAKLIHDHNPKRHIDIASRVDGFVAHVASFREIEVIDVRPLPESEHESIKFVQADVMKPQDLGKTDSLSCLHAIEHFGLGRYTDTVDVEGHNKGISNLVDLVAKGGRLYISFPIGKQDEVHFNAHRVFHVETILHHPSIKECMRLVRFDFVDDSGSLHTDVDIGDVGDNIQFGCGIYTFVKDQ